MAYLQKLFDTNFMEYASYVIKDRAIPHLDDGLKPVQRRILHSLFRMDDGKFNKVANVVGHCMQYHPHGDASIYSALVVLANKDLFIEKQGNFGNIFTGDQASAARYIECRLFPFAREVLYNPEITVYEDSYDGRNKEPVVFPAKIPVVLIHGAEGIAVGMATKILPHNLKEVLTAVKAALNGKRVKLYPDFETGGKIDVSGYNDGQGKVLVRAVLDISDPKRILITDLPYGCTTETLINSIEDAARKNKIKIASINDFTTDKVEIEVKLPRGVQAEDMLDAMYAFTDCEVSISVNLLVIKDNTPIIMTVSEIIQYHSQKLVEILKAELKLEESKLRQKLHDRTLDQIFIEERIYKKIEAMKTQEKVVSAVKEGFVPFADKIKRPVTDEDVERLLKIPIRRISLYDINKARKEMKEILDRLKEIKAHLQNLIGYAIGYVDSLLEKMGKSHPRRTEIISIEQVDVKEAAQRNLKLRYDETSGYLGYNVSSGKVLFDVSHLDKILVIRKTGGYSVIKIPDKLFVDKGMLFCSLAEKEILASTVFSVIYRDPGSGLACIKRFQIEKYIVNKGYSLVPEDAEVLGLAVGEDISIQMTFVPKPRLKSLEETVPVNEFMIKGVKAIGVRLSHKEVESVKFLRVVNKSNNYSQGDISGLDSDENKKKERESLGGETSQAEPERRSGILLKKEASSGIVKKSSPGKSSSGISKKSTVKKAAGATGKAAKKVVKKADKKSAKKAVKKIVKKSTKKGGKK